MKRRIRIAERARSKAFSKIIMDILGHEGIPAMYLERKKELLMARVD
ncbi:MAG: hypothetical protein ACFFCS_22095 [Candidatus Hodarchaeota archaeon]